MKKLLLSLLLACSAVGVSAQENSAYADNTFFLSLNAGGSYYMHSGTGEMGVPAAGFYLGRWIMCPLAFRFAGDMVMAPPFKQEGTGATATYLMASTEFMWDVNATFFHVYNKNFLYPFPVYPLIGLGLMYMPEGDGYSGERDFQGMLGFQLPVRIAKQWDLYLEYKCFFLPYNFENSNGANMMHTATLGITRRWSDNPYGRRTGFESRNTSEDWFTGFGVGMLFNSYEFEHVGRWDSKLYNITGDMMVGRNYSDIWTIRFELSGFFGRGRAHIGTTSDIDENGDLVTTETMNPGKWYTFNSLHTDFMINLSHLANFNRGVKWNFLPYLGAGPVWKYRDPVFTLGADAGIMARRYIDNMGDFYIDLKYLIVPPRFTGETGPEGYYYGVGFPMLTFGYICNFGHSTTRYRIPVGADINCK